ncbi:MAG: hypothetical protein JWO82_3960 [Akkermansiaceae bacterium]|nr:hypothetical protein [Akkermansiaceae bacterium]
MNSISPTNIFRLSAFAASALLVSSCASQKTPVQGRNFPADIYVSLPARINPRETAQEGLPQNQLPTFKELSRLYANPGERGSKSASFGPGNNYASLKAAGPGGRRAGILAFSAVKIQPEIHVGKGPNYARLRWIGPFPDGRGQLYEGAGWARWTPPGAATGTEGTLKIHLSDQEWETRLNSAP